MVAVTDGPTVTTVPRRFPSRMVLPAPAPVRVRLLLTTTRFRVVAAVYVPAAIPIVSPLAASPIATSMLAQGGALAAPQGAAAAPPGATYQVAAAACAEPAPGVRPGAGSAMRSGTARTRGAPDGDHREWRPHLHNFARHLSAEMTDTSSSPPHCTGQRNFPMQIIQVMA